jgi:hypothetical protein
MLDVVLVQRIFVDRRGWIKQILGLSESEESDTRQSPVFSNVQTF